MASAKVVTVFQVFRSGTSPLLPSVLTSHRLSSNEMFDSAGAASSTWMPMTSELGAPMMVTVRLASYFVVSVPS